jgi:DNA polymerase-1
MGIPGELRPLLLPDENCLFLHFDYSQQEPGVAGHLSNDRALLDDYTHGDVYTNLGRRMGLIKSEMPPGEVRTIRNSILKSLMLSIIYGKSAMGIARDLPCTPHQAVLHLQQFERTYSRLFAWLRSYVAVSMEQGFAENIIGYRACYRVRDPKTRSHLARSCQNFCIQSSAAACFQATGLHLADFGADIRLPLHDAYLLNVPDDPRSLAEAQEQIDAATIAANSAVFPGLTAKRDLNVLYRFAKDGKEDSFEKWLASLEVP